MKLIAETAWHHDGDFEFQKKLITDIAVKSNADIIKMHISLDPHEYLAPDFPSYSIAKTKLFSEWQWTELVNIIRSNGKELMLLLNDSKAVNLAIKLKPEIVEIHSVAINDFNLLNCFKQAFDTNVIKVIGVGGCTLYEIQNAIDILSNQNLVLMFGFQNYPTKYSDINFNKIRRVINLFSNVNFGYADHTAWNEKDNILITLMGASLGMGYIEKHVTNNYGQKRTDFEAAISIEMFNDLENKLRLLEECNGDGSLNLNLGEKKYAKTGLMKRAPFVNTDIKKDQILERKNISFYRTAGKTNMSQSEILDYIGQKFVVDLPSGSLLQKEYLSE